MQKYVQREINRSLSSRDIEQLTGGCCMVIEYSRLADVDKIGDILRPDMPVVVLFETVQDYGHWTCLIDHGDHIEFFDSYGGKPDSELLWVPAATRRELGQDKPYMTQLLAGHPVVYSNVELQDKKAATCGRWVSARINMRHMPLPEFAVEFCKHPVAPDAVVVLATPLRESPPPARLRQLMR